MGDCFKSTGLVVKERRDLASFDSLRIDRRLNVVLVEDSVNFIEVEAGEHLQEFIVTDVNNGKLTLRNDNKCNWTRSYKVPVNMELHYTNLHHIVMWGASNVSNEDTLKTNPLKVEFRDASGNMELTVDNLETSIIMHTGAGDMVMHGKTDALSVYMASLAYGEYTDLNARTVYVENKSAADCRVFAWESFAFRLRGDGNIFYKGNGEVTLSDKTGRGSITQIY